MTDKIDQQIKIWEKTVDVQMHFNDICMRLRAISVSALGVLLGAAALSYRYAGNLELANVTVPFYIPVLFLFLLVIILVTILDPIKNKRFKFFIDFGLAVGLVAIILIGPAFPDFRIEDQIIPVSTFFIAIAVCLNFGFWWLDRYWYHQLLRGAVDHNKKLEVLIRKQLPGINLAMCIKARGDEPVLGLSIGGGHRIDLFYAIILFVLLIALIGSIYGVSNAT